MTELDQFQRLRMYREKARKYETKEIQAFKLAVYNGLYPEKCLACYEAGIRWCQYWNRNFECEEFEIGEREEIAKKFR